MKKRMKFFWWLLRAPVAVFLKIKLGYTYKIAKNLPNSDVRNQIQKEFTTAVHKTDEPNEGVVSSIHKRLKLVNSGSQLNLPASVSYDWKDIAKLFRFT